MHGVSHIFWHFSQTVDFALCCMLMINCRGNERGKSGETVVSDHCQCGAVNGSVRSGYLLLKTSLAFAINGLFLPFYKLKSNGSVYTP